MRHSREKNGEGRPDVFDVSAEEINSLCGDAVQVFVSNRDGVTQIRFEAEGCALCQASASIMTNKLTGRPLSYCQKETASFLANFPQGDVPDGETLEVAALFDMKRFPAREKCVLLPWLALNKCLT